MGSWKIAIGTITPSKLQFRFEFSSGIVQVPLRSTLKIAPQRRNVTVSLMFSSYLLEDLRFCNRCENSLAVLLLFQLPLTKLVVSSSPVSILLPRRAVGFATATADAVVVGLEGL